GAKHEGAVAHLRLKLRLALQPELTPGRRGDCEPPRAVHGHKYVAHISSVASSIRQYVTDYRAGAVPAIVAPRSCILAEWYDGSEPDSNRLRLARVRPAPPILAA